MKVALRFAAIVAASVMALTAIPAQAQDLVKANAQKLQMVLGHTAKVLTPGESYTGGNHRDVVCVKDDPKMVWTISAPQLAKGHTCGHDGKMSKSI